MCTSRLSLALALLALLIATAGCPAPREEQLDMQSQDTLDASGDSDMSESPEDTPRDMTLEEEDSPRDMSYEDMDRVVDMMNGSHPVTPRFEWVRYGGGTESEDEIDAVASDAQGNVYTSGKFTGTIKIGEYELTSNGEADIFVAKYDRAGELRWVEQFGAAGEDNIYDAVCDSQGDLILSGQFEQTVAFGEHVLTSQGSSDVVIMKMTADKEVLWAKSFGTKMSDGGNEVSVDSKDHIIVGTGTGVREPGFIGDALVIESPHFDAPISFAHQGRQDAYLFKLDPQGDALWVRRIAGPGVDRAKSIAVAQNDDILFGGDFARDAILEGDGMQRTLSSRGKQDAWMSRWGSQGDYIWHTSWGGAGDDLAKGVARAEDGGHYVVGSFEQTVNFDDAGSTRLEFELTSGSAEEQNLFLLKRDAAHKIQWLRHIESAEAVQGAELEHVSTGGAIFGCSISGDTRLGRGDDPSVEVLTTQSAFIQPMLVHYDALGQLVSHTLMREVENGRFDELSISGDAVFVDLVYRSQFHANIIEGNILPELGQKDFALVKFVLP